MTKNLSLRLIGPTVKYRREQLELSQDELAQRANLVRSYISRIESGERVPSLEVLGRLARAMGVLPVYLFLADEHLSAKSVLDEAVTRSLMRVLECEEDILAIIAANPS